MATMKLGEATCRVEHAHEWAIERVNPCAVCYGIEWMRRDIAHSTVELDGDES